MAAIETPDLGPVRVGTPSLGPAVEPRRARPAVFLDRDGVLNEVVGAGNVAASPLHVDDVRLAPLAAPAMGALAAAGYTLVVVTNQPDVARGEMSLDTAVAMTRYVVDSLGLDDGYVCPHDGPDRCPCRKPKAGLLDRAAVDWTIEMTNSWLIGDRWVDIGAATAAGVRSVLLERPYSWERAGGALPPADLEPSMSVISLDVAVEVVLSAQLR